jgi:hypothetical protein
VGADIGVAFQQGKLGDHRVGRGDLVFAAEGPEDGARADGAVEHFAEAALGGDVEGTISDR